MSIDRKNLNVNESDIESSTVFGQKGEILYLRTMTNEHLINRMAGWQARIITLRALIDSLGQHCAEHIRLMVEDLEESVAVCNYVLLKREGRKVPDLGSFLEGF
jgi:hypothetical protein